MSAESDRPQQIVPGIDDGQLPELFRERREAGLAVTGHVRDIIDDAAATPEGFLDLKETGATRQERLLARRCLRAIAEVSRKDSAVLRAIGEAGLYPWAEAVIDDGASTRTYLELVTKDGLTAEEATSIYFLRRLITEATGGSMPSFPAIRSAVERLGITLQDAAADPYATAASLDEAGFFVTAAGRSTFDHPIFAPNLAGAKLGHNQDSTYADDDTGWFLRTAADSRLSDESEE